jgi:hypothetical protein
MKEKKTFMNSPMQRHLGAPYGRLVVRGTLLVVVLLTLIALLSILEQRRTDREMGAILSALFSDQGVQDRSAGPEIQIVFLREAQNAWAGTDFRRGLLFDRGSSFSESSSPLTRASFILSNVFPRNIRANLQLPSGARAFFISRRELEEPRPRDFQTRFPNNLGYFVVSHVGLNLSKTEAIFSGDHICSGLCGGGDYFLMRKVNGVWRVVDQHVVWVS